MNLSLIGKRTKIAAGICCWFFPVLCLNIGWRHWAWIFPLWISFILFHWSDSRQAVIRNTSLRRLYSSSAFFAGFGLYMTTDVFVKAGSLLLEIHGNIWVLIFGSAMILLYSYSLWFKDELV